MGTVTAYDMASIQSALGGSNPISLNEYYRGGSYVPTTRSSTTREPTSGENYSVGTPAYYFINFVGNGNTGVAWQGSVNVSVPGEAVTSYTYGGYTYYRGTFRQRVAASYFQEYRYGIYRTYSTSTSINTGVPSSGQISISQLYGAANP